MKIRHEKLAARRVNAPIVAASQSEYLRTNDSKIPIRYLQPYIQSSRLLGGKEPSAVEIGNKYYSNKMQNQNIIKLSHVLFNLFR